MTSRMCTRTSTSLRTLSRVPPLRKMSVTTPSPVSGEGGVGGRKTTPSPGPSPEVGEGVVRHQLVLGIDPGLATTGWGIVEKSSKLTLKAFGAILSPAGTPLPERL